MHKEYGQNINSGLNHAHVKSDREKDSSEDLKSTRG